MIVAAAWLYRADSRTFYLVTNEDGWVENAQVALFFAGSALAAGIAWRLRRTGARFWFAVYALAALTLFVVAGEELSWGERLLGFEGPAWVRRRNLQRELNLHNLSAVAGPVSSASAAALAAGCGLALLRALVPDRVARWRPELWMPDPALLPGLLFCLAYAESRHLVWTVLPRSRWTRILVSRSQEVVELVLALTVVLFLVTVALELRRRSPPS
ncbi:MAG: hypothetical protein ACREQY_04410 [Candidatus Binatia bacterium]